MTQRVNNSPTVYLRRSSTWLKPMVAHRLIMGKQDETLLILPIRNGI